MTDLLDAVDALTKPRIEHLPQIDDDGKWLKAHTVEHPPLLVQLKEAVNPSTNTAAGSSSLASTRNLVDSDALFEYSTMTAAIGDWCHIIQSERTRDPVVDLRRWYIAFNRTDSDPSFYLAELNRWAKLIRNILEPPKRMEVTTPCPVCDKRTWTDPEGNELLFPVVVEYKVPQDGEAIKPTALCRACDAVWKGFDAVKELAEELNEPEEAG